MRLRKHPSNWIWWVVFIAALALAIAEVAWMGERVSTHRALRAAAPSGTPTAKLSLPLTGFKP